jgi:hypothetical protein
LKAGEWFRRGRLIMVSPVHGDYRRCQAEIPLIILCRFPGPALPPGPWHASIQGSPCSFQLRKQRDDFAAMLAQIPTSCSFLRSRHVAIVSSGLAERVMQPSSLVRGT